MFVYLDTVCLITAYNAEIFNDKRQQCKYQHYRDVRCNLVYNGCW